MEKLTPQICLRLILMTAVFVKGNAEIDFSICREDTQKTGSPLVRMPKSYEADIELTNRILNTTKFVTEVYDDDTRRGVITTYYNGMQNKIIHDHGKNDVVIKIEEMRYGNFYEQSQCRVFKYEKRLYNLFLTYTDVALKNTRTVPINGIMDTNDKFFDNKGLTTVRNIDAEYWEDCYYIEEVDGTFNVKVYWSSNSTIPPSGDARVPLRIEIKGKYKGPDKYMPVDDVYDIVWFTAKPVLNDELFQPPLGIYCTDDKITKDFPSIGDVFSVDMEIIETGKKGIQSVVYESIWYNVDMQLMRVDYDAVSPKDIAMYNSNQLISIRDYKYGVEYTMDSFRTTCNVSPLNTMDAPTKDSLFFENIKNFEYLGKYDIRDVKCDVWVGKADSGLTVEWAFLDESWKEEEGGELESRVPVQSLWYNWNADKTKEMRSTRNFFSYRRDAEPTDQFDITPCFPSNYKRHFQVAFSIADPDSVNLEELKRNARRKIHSLISISALRVDQVEAEYDDNAALIYLEFTLLEKAKVPGNPANPSEPDVSLDVATQFLDTAVKGNQFFVSVILDGKPGQLHALHNSLRELEAPKGPCGAPQGSGPHSYGESVPRPSDRELATPTTGAPVSEEDNMDKYNAGQLAGLAVGMFILGGALGIIAMLLLLLHIDRSRGAQDGLRLYDKEATAASSPQDFSPVTETSVD